jgi:hypothetical protein
MLEEIKELNWNEDILKKYDIKSIQVINEPNLEPTIYINLNNGIRLDSIKLLITHIFYSNEVYKNMSIS